METGSQSPKFVPERSTAAGLCGPAVEFFDPASGGCNSRSLVREAPIDKLYTSAIPSPLAIQTLPNSADEEVNEPADRLRAILARLTGLECFGPNWDSYGSQPPASSAITKARNLVWEVVGKDFAHFGVRAIPYTAAPLSGGGVQIEWQGPSGSVEVEIGPHCEFGYLMTRQRPEETEERDNVSEDEVLRLISASIA